jgi:hypothetical protein
MKNKTAKQQAKSAIQLALWGRMSDLISEVDENFESGSEKNKAEIKRHIQIYLDRIEKYIK